MEIQELGVRLRARRAAAGETIASVAMRAGLSVPYIANLENGRGNPTLTALSALAQALGADLRGELAEPSIANVENAGGIRALGAHSALAQAVGAGLRVERAEPGGEPQPGPPTK